MGVVRQRAVATLPTLMRALRRKQISPNPKSSSTQMCPQPYLPSLRRAFSLYDQINLIDNLPDDQLRFQRFHRRRREEEKDEDVRSRRREEGRRRREEEEDVDVRRRRRIREEEEDEEDEEVEHVTNNGSRFMDTGFNVNGVDYEGSILCVGNLLMSWSPKKFSEITADSLSIFQVVRPIPEILILGCGRYIQPVDPELRHFVRSTGMKLEAVDSRNAASTYNILNEEGRIVAAALLPYGVSS